MTSFVHTVATRGYHRFIVRPAHYSVDRLATADQMRKVISVSRASLTGWSFPAVAHEDEIESHQDYICSSTDFMYYREHWRLYKSAQFVQWAAYPEDWLQDSVSGSNTATEYQEPEISLANIIARISSFFEFAARFAAEVEGEQTFYLEYSARGLSGRVLRFDFPNRVPPVETLRSNVSRYEFHKSFSLEDLLGQNRQLARREITEFLDRFGWRVSEQSISSLQEEVLRYSRSS